MRQCQHTGHPPHGAIGLWFAHPARQHTHTPTHQATTAPPSHREPVSLPHPGVRRMPTAHFLHTRQRCPLRWLPHRRPARRTPTQGHRQTPQTNASHKHRSPVLAHGLGCHMRGCRMRARHLHRASGLPHRRAHAHGPMAAPAPLHPGPVPCGRSPLPYTALYSPLSLGTAPARATARGGRLYVRLVHGIARQLHRWGIVRRINWLGLRVLVFAGVFGCCGHGVYLLPQV